MSAPLRLVTLERLRPLLDRRKVLLAVRQALIRQAEGKVQSPLPGHLIFREPYGDCHIKYGHIAGQATFAVKIATGFYDNPERGLPVNQGLVLVFDAETGVPLTLMLDEGWLTAWRTAAACALAAAALRPARITAVGIIGTGFQAGLAIEWLPETLGDQPFVIWGRDGAKAEDLANEHVRSGRRVRAAGSIEELLAACNVVVTATPSSNALFDAALVRPGTHIVALGADTPGKQELPAELFGRAARILTDDHDQCLDHGDFGNAVRAGFVRPDEDSMLGEALAHAPPRDADDITIVDLTGIAAEDAAVAELFLGLLAAKQE
jgi:ornithine cyclodeaminase